MADALVDSPDPTVRLSRLQQTKMLEHYLFGTVAVLFVAIVVAGFARSYYHQGMLTAHLPSWIVHLHAMLMTVWVALFVVQAALVPAGRIRLHQRLGYAAIGLAVAIGVVGIWTAIRAAKYGSASVPPQFSEPTFSIVPLGDIVLFTLFFGAAVYFRRTASTHKRLILLTVLNFLPPAIGRLPFATVQANPVAWLLGIIAGGAMVCLAFDWWRYGRINLIFLAGAVILIASFPIRIALMGTQAWMSFSTWLSGFG